MVGRGGSSPGHKGGISEDLSPHPDRTSRDPSARTAAGHTPSPEGFWLLAHTAWGTQLQEAALSHPAQASQCPKGVHEPRSHPHWTCAGVRGVVPWCSWPGPRKLNGWGLRESSEGPNSLSSPTPRPSLPGRGLLGGPCQHSFLLPSWNAEGVGEEEPENTHPPSSPSLGSHQPLPDSNHLLQEASGGPTSPEPRGPVLVLP